MSKKSKRFKTKRRVWFAVVTVVLLIAASVVIIFHLKSDQTKVQPTTMTQAEIATRLARINAIYASLKLGPDYVETQSTVFGDKQVYSYDKNRSYSSSKIYIVKTNVDVTTANLSQNIEQAGFKYFEEPYPGATFKELHFKSRNNEYVRLNVISKTLLDNAPVSRSSKIDPNLGPSQVTIKVNLDDNNE